MRYNSQTSKTRTVIKPSQFRKVMIGILGANILCFFLLAVLVCCTYLFLYLHTVNTTTARYTGWFKSRWIENVPYCGLCYQTIVTVICCMHVTNADDLGL